MFVADWMTQTVVTVGPDASLSGASQQMREKGVKHLPVVDGGRVVGMLSDRDVRSFTPSKATALDVFELHYLLAKAAVREAMTPGATTVAPDTPIEEAALLLLDRNIGALPVVADGVLVGIITDADIFRALIDVSGVRHGGHRICLTVQDRAGSIRDAADIVRRHGFNLQGLLTSYEGVPSGLRRVVLRTSGDGDFRALAAELEASYRDVRITRG